MYYIFNKKKKIYFEESWIKILILLHFGTHGTGGFLIES